MRFGILTRSDPDTANELLDLAQRDVDERFAHYEQLASLDYSQ